MPATAGSRPRCRTRSCRPGRSRTRARPHRSGPERRRCRATVLRARMRSLGPWVCLPRRRSLGARAARHIPGSAPSRSAPADRGSAAADRRSASLPRVGEEASVVVGGVRGLWDSRGLLGVRTWRSLDARDRLNRFIDQSTERRSAGGGARGLGRLRSAGLCSALTGTSSPIRSPRSTEVRMRSSSCTLRSNSPSVFETS